MSSQITCSQWSSRKLCQEKKRDQSVFMQLKKKKKRKKQSHERMCCRAERPQMADRLRLNTFLLGGDHVTCCTTSTNKPAVKVLVCFLPWFLWTRAQHTVSLSPVTQNRNSSLSFCLVAKKFKIHWKYTKHVLISVTVSKEKNNFILYDKWKNTLDTLVFIG